MEGRGAWVSFPEGKVFYPLCIGALVRAYQAGKWTKEDYEKYGPNLLIEIKGTYLYDYWGYNPLSSFETRRVVSQGGKSSYSWWILS
jgi:hypothetical protein